MTLTQLITQMKAERAQAAAHLHALDSALEALALEAPTDAQPAPTTVPKATTGRVWTAEQKMKLSAALKKSWAKKKQTKE